LRIPNKISRQISDYLLGKGGNANKDYPTSPSSENGLTGELIKHLKRGWSRKVECGGYYYSWRIRGRIFGPGNQFSSEEKKIGADGIIQVELDRYRVDVNHRMNSGFNIKNVTRITSFRKGVLFQAKRTELPDAQKLCEELKVIEGHTKDHGICLLYDSGGYEVIKGTEVIELSGNVNKVDHAKRLNLDKFLTEEFLPCHIGIEGLYVDLDQTPQTLFIPKSSPVRTELNPIRVSGALSIQITAFKTVSRQGKKRKR
jgi:hypothetical protein